MLYIYTDKNLTTKQYINDVDNEFILLSPCIDTMFTDELSMNILREIEGVTERYGGVIVTKFGATVFNNLSTGCKALLLCAIQSETNAINMDGAGYNVISMLYEIAKTKDIEVVTHRELKYFSSNDYQAYVNNELNTGEDITYALEYALNVEE